MDKGNFEKSFSFSLGEDISGKNDFELKAGSSLFFVGANGSGKTRLAVKIEESLGSNAHRISAHRALNLNPSVAKISESNALNICKRLPKPTF